MGQVQRLTLMASSQNINGNDDDEDRDSYFGGEQDTMDGWITM